MFLHYFIYFIVFYSLLFIVWINFFVERLGRGGSKADAVTSSGALIRCSGESDHCGTHQGRRQRQRHRGGGIRRGGTDDGRVAESEAAAE